MTFEFTPTRQKNLAIAHKAALIKHQELKTDRIKKYNTNPKLCLQCNGAIDYDKQINKFCSKSCSCSYNNIRRDAYSDATKLKISTALTGKSSPFKGKLGGNSNVCNVCKVFFKKCPICEKPFYTRGGGTYGRKTCSRDCATITKTKLRPYQNGSRKNTKYFNIHQQKEILLESSWEVAVAEKLDNLNIIWTRPYPIKWIDSKEKSHLYYPDFFLPVYDLYLDPKNPYCMKQDMEKMSVVRDIINLKYGSLEYILKVVDNIYKK